MLAIPERVWIDVRVCTDRGWESIVAQALRDDVAACYALPRQACRRSFWAERLGESIPAGRALIWQTLGEVF